MSKKNLNEKYRMLKEAGFNSYEIKKLKYRHIAKIRAYVRWGNQYKKHTESWELEKSKFIEDPNYIPEVE